MHFQCCFLPIWNQFKITFLFVVPCLLHHSITGLNPQFWALFEGIQITYVNNLNKQCIISELAYPCKKKLNIHVFVPPVQWRSCVARSLPRLCCCLREWVENQRESVRLSVHPSVVRRADWRGAQFMEECYGYERNKMAMVIGVMEEDLGCCLPLSHPLQLSSSVSFWGGLTDIPWASRRDQPHKGRAVPRGPEDTRSPDRISHGAADTASICTAFSEIKR